jgi:hypothetical protein
VATESTPQPISDVRSERNSPSKKAEKIKALLARLIEEKSAIHHYGRVSLELDFKDGQIDKAYFVDRVEIR